MCICVYVMLAYAPTSHRARAPGNIGVASAGTARSRIDYGLRVWLILSTSTMLKMAARIAVIHKVLSWISKSKRLYQFSHKSLQL